MKVDFGKLIECKGKNYNLNVNPALECLGVIYVLSEFELNTPRSNRRYLASIKGFFQDFENHELIVKFKELLVRDSFKQKRNFKIRNVFPPRDNDNPNSFGYASKTSFLHNNTSVSLKLSY